MREREWWGVGGLGKSGLSPGAAAILWDDVPGGDWRSGRVVGGRWAWPGGSRPSGSAARDAGEVGSVVGGLRWGVPLGQTARECSRVVGRSSFVVVFRVSPAVSPCRELEYLTAGPGPGGLVGGPSELLPPAPPQHLAQLGTVYATKRRRRNGKSLKPPPKDGVTKSNPSKRHRERLNAELDTLANLLPFEQNILSKLDRLSILRLSVSYLRTKSYFQVTMHKEKEEAAYRGRGDLGVYDHSMLDGDMFLQALNGFLLILTCEGEVFFATHTIENYLGFHQSDIVHQSVYELVHSEDREELQRQLLWNSFLPADSNGLALQDTLHPERSHLLERSFTVRFRCLLDNTSGFLRLDIRGRIKVLHGQNRKTEEPPLALFALCTPFGPPSLLEIPHKEVMFKSKHKLDLSLVSMDQRGKMLLGYSDAELADMGGYDLVHYDDLAYVASAHQELLKTGASGMIAYRYQSKEGQWQWLQTSSRLVYKNSKPDFVISTHRPLMEEEGRDLLGKRTMDFKVSYLDAGLTNSYFSDSELVGSSTPSSASQVSTPQRVNRRYKTQLRDFLSTCRTKRKISSHSTVVSNPETEFIVPDPAAAVAAAYSNLNMYGSSYPATAPPESYMGHSGNFHQTLYDNRFLTSTTDNLFHQYRPLGSYYPDYHSTGGYVSNGFLDMSPRNSSCLPTYETPHHQIGKTDCDKGIYPCHQPLEHKYATVIDNTRYGKCLDVGGYAPPIQGVVTVPLNCDIPPQHKKSVKSMDNLSSSNSAGSSPAGVNGMVTPKMEDMKEMMHQYEQPRQTVLMWGAAHTPTSSSSRSPQGGSPISYQDKKFGDPLKSLAEMNTMAETKWKPETPPHVASPKYTHYQYSDPGQEIGRGVRLPSDKQDGSPLLSISQVTNTLLNQ